VKWELRANTVTFRVERTELGDGITLFVLSGAPSFEEWLGALDEGAAWLVDLERRGIRTRVVIDPSELGIPSARARRAFGEWRAAHMPLIINVCSCAAYVASSPVMRGVLAAVFWFARPLVPVEILPTRREALAWAVSRAALR
jgi:hypothetical protein